MMNETPLNKKQASSLLALFIIGSVLYLGGAALSNQDSWISFLLTFLLALLFFAIIAYVLNHNPNSTVYTVFIELFGPIVGKFMTLLFAVYALTVSILSLRNSALFIHTVIFPETPEIVTLLFLTLLPLTLIKVELKTIGKNASAIFPVILFIFILSHLFLTQNMDFTNFLPILIEKPRDIIMKGLYYFTFSFGPAVLFLGIPIEPKKQAIAKSLMVGNLFGAFILFIVRISNVAIMGVELADYLHYPAFATYSIVNIGDFIKRIEVLLSFNVIFSMLTNVCVGTYVSAKGAVNLLNKKNFHPFVIPSVLIINAGAYFLFNSFDEMIEFQTKLFSVFFAFQIGLPLSILFAMVIRNIIRKRKTADPSS
jgi:spore germination protein KB